MANFLLPFILSILTPLFIGSCFSLAATFKKNFPHFNNSIRLGINSLFFNLYKNRRILPQNLMKISIDAPEIFNLQGMPLSASMTAIVRVGRDRDSIRRAASYFHSDAEEVICDTLRVMLSAIFHAILSRQPIERVYSGRQKILDDLGKHASAQLAPMGIEIICINLEKLETGAELQHAIINSRIANFSKDFRISEIEAEKEIALAKINTRLKGEMEYWRAESEIENLKFQYEFGKEKKREALNSQKARADWVGALEKQRGLKKLVQQSMKNKLAEAENNITLAQMELLRKKLELDASIKLTADAEYYCTIRKTHARIDVKKLEIILEAAVRYADGCPLTFFQNDKIGKRKKFQPLSAA